MSTQRDFRGNFLALIAAVLALIGTFGYYTHGLTFEQTVVSLLIALVLLVA